MSINRVEVSGNLTRDPEVRRTQAGLVIVSFGVAVNDRRKNNQTGEWEDYPNFFDCTMFGTRAESVSRFLSKGQKVVIDGKLRYETWERDGQRRSAVKIIVDDIDFVYPPKSDDAGGHGPAGQAATAPAPARGGAGDGLVFEEVVEPYTSIYDEDIPF